jgi:hypothetical protein
VLELDASGHLIHMTPTGGETGSRNGTLLVLLGLRSARPHRPAPQDGQLPGEWRPAGLAADPCSLGCRSTCRKSGPAESGE